VSAPTFATTHTGMRVDYQGLLRQARSGLSREPALGEMLRQLTDHITEMGQRFYAGDSAAVDEFLQLYCVDRDGRLAAAGVAPDLYFIQDTRTYVGNCPMWWGPNNRGYTTDITQAGRYTLERAIAQHRCRPTDKPWKCADIEALVRHTIDMQDLRKVAPVVISDEAPA
jgi:hypothetical protein